MVEKDKIKDDVSDENDELIGKVTIINDGRRIINWISNPPVQPGFMGKKIRSDYISRLQLTRTLNKYKIRLMKLDLNDKKTVMITLTLDPSKNIKLRDFKRYIVNFIKILHKYFNDFIYIRRIESNKCEYLFHVHIVLCFDNEIPKQLTNEWVKSKWKYGEQVNVSQFDSPWNAIGYITKFNEYEINKYDKNNTKYPSFMKVLTYSHDIPKSQNIKQYYLNKEDMKQEIKILQESDMNKYVQCHKYIDKNTGECKETVDNILFY